MQKESGIIFDFDNLLVATNQFVIDHLSKTCQKSNMTLPTSEIITAVLKKNLSFENIFTELFGDRGAGILATYRDTAMETPYRATEEGLEFVQGQLALGILMIIVSNRVNKLEERLTQAGYNPKDFLAILKAEPAKPDQKAYDPAIALLQEKEIPKSRIKIFGDHPDDYLACPDDLRTNFVAVTTGLTTREGFIKVGVNEQNIWQSLKHPSPSIT